MLVTGDARELRRIVGQARRSGRRVGCVPTMGALHAGHMSLVEASRREADFTLVTLFVNPTQFGPQEDFTRYPRPFERDKQLCEQAGVDLIFCPEVETIYPPGGATIVDVGPVAEPLEGAFRPGHFRGVATVVLKLFNLASPDVAFFGQKDHQQTLVVRRMTTDLRLPVEIRVLPILREPDGLAMSSRNVYLSPTARGRALALSRALRAVESLVADGERDVATLEGEFSRQLAALPGLSLDYAVIRDAESLAVIGRVEAPAAALVAARVEGTRLIDNAILSPPKSASEIRPPDENR